MNQTIGLYLAGPGRLVPVLDQEADFHQLKYRTGCVAQACLEIFTNALDGAIGLGAGALYRLTLRKYPCFSECSANYLPRLNFILPETFYYLIKAVNSAARFECSAISDYTGLTKALLNFVASEHCFDLVKAPDPITKHLVTRVAILGLAAVLMLAVITDHFIAVIATVSAFASRGKYKSLNFIAYQSLQSPQYIVLVPLLIFKIFILPSTL